jgi:hypothetical protein
MSELSRRTLVVGAAIIPAIGVPGAAIAARADDPIFAAIERFKVADKNYYDVREPVDTDGKLALDTPEYEAYEEARDKADDIALEAQRALLGIQPLTIAGAVAFIGCCLESGTIIDIHADDAREVLRTLEASLARFVGA